MTITLNGTSGIVNDATSLSYTGTLTGGTGVVNLGSGQVYKDASGNVGIGVTPPTGSGSYRALNVGAAVAYGNTGLAVAAFNNNGDINDKYVITGVASSYIQSGGNHIWYGAASGTAGAAISYTERARIDSSGNLLVGGTTAGAKVRIETNLSPQDGLDIKNTTNNTGNSFVAFFNYNNVAAGSITQPTATTVAYNTSSDYRLKEAIAPMTGALAKVALLKPCTYTWKEEFGGTNGQGFIAHELQAVVPECVSGAKDAVETYTDEDGVEQTRPKYQGIDTSFLVATLTAAIQEQQTLITALTARITALEAQIV